MTLGRAIPLWQEGVEFDATTRRSAVGRSAVDGVVESDVVIVGGGYTGLWTAFYLKQLAPQLSITIVESQFVGFGGSGRNGGWCSAFLPMSPSEMSAEHGAQAMRFLQDQMFATVDEIARVAQVNNIECDFHKGGTITSASDPAHVERLHHYIDDWHAAGFSDSDMTWENADQISKRIRVSSTLGGMYSPHCAVVNPWKLVTGLARTIENLGVVIFEDSRALSLGPQRVVLEHGEVRAKWVVNALESFTSQLPSGKRKIVPLYSLMVATEPLSESVWRSLGWTHRETFADGRNMVTYAQRTADNRIAFGGRGAPYHFGSSISDRFDRNKTIHGRLEQTVRDIFPQVAEAQFTHHWGGPVGAPRDWHAFANVDTESGLCAGGGYVGDGVALSSLVGRTLAHQIVDTGDALTRCALVNHQSKKWEIEPLRWLGVNSLLALTEYADKAERRTHRPMKRLLALRDGLLG